MFAPVSFTPSPSMGNITEGLAASLGSLAASISAGAASLGGLGLPPSGPSDMQEAVEKLSESASKSLAAPVRYMALTPFQHGIGTKKGEYAYLTPQNAINALSQRFSGLEMPEEGETGLVILLAAAENPRRMGQILDGFNAVYPIAELEQACRRAKALATLETDKFVIPKGPVFPAWGNIAPQVNRTGQEMTKAVGGMLAAGAGAAQASAAPGDMLAAFAQKQQTKAAQRQEKLNGLNAAMAGGTLDGWRGLYVEGAGASIFSYLSKLPMPFDDAFKNSAVLCFSGPPEQLAYYRESFGLCRRNLLSLVCLTCSGSNPECPF